MKMTASELRQLDFVNTSVNKRAPPHKIICVVVPIELLVFHYNIILF